MSDKQLHSSELNTDQVVAKVQGFFEKFGKQLAIVVAAIIVIFGGMFAYKTYILKPKEEKASEYLFKAQQFFAQDSSQKVLDGDGTSKGVLYVISNFSGTKSANIAKYYAGVSYLKLGKFDKAIEFLKDFSTDAKQIQMVAYGCLGDAFAESGKKEDALDYYIKAGNTFVTDESGSAEFLFRGALLSETIGKEEKALELYKQIKEKYPKTEKGTQVDKYINRLSTEKPDL